MKYFSDKALDNRIKEIASTVSGYEAGDGIDISSFVISVNSEKYSDWNEAHSAVSNLGSVADGDSRLVNGDTVYDFVMSHLSSVFRPLGITTTPVYDGDSVHTSVLIGGQWHEAVSGDVVTYGSKEFFWNTALTPNQWSEFGDIYALWQQVGSTGVDAQTLELKVHNYVGVKKGLIFEETSEDDYRNSPAHLMLRNLGTSSEPNYALYTPYALITGGDQIVGSGTPGGGGGGGASYLGELRDVEFGLSPSVGQILVYAANVPLNPDGTQYGPGWTVTNMPSGDVTSISVNSQTYSPVGGVVTLPNYPTIPSTYAWSAITGTPTTLEGYGITDAKIENGVITLGGNMITPLTSHQTIYSLTLKVGTSTVGSYTPNSSAQTLTVTAQNLYDTIGSTKYHPYGGDTESPTFKIGGATLTWHPESSVGAGDAYLEIDSALLTLGDQIVMSGTPGGGGEGAGYLYELKDTISSWTAKPSVSATQVLVFDPQAQDKESNTGAWKYVPATDIGRVYQGGTGITIDGNEISVTANTYVSISGTETITGTKTFSNPILGSSIEVKRYNSNYASVIKFSNVTDGVLGYLGFGGSSDAEGIRPIYYNGANSYTLYHSGNLTKSVLTGLLDASGGYYLPLVGGMMSGTITTIATIVQQINAYNNDTWIWNVTDTTGQARRYGYGLLYEGSGSGIANYLKLYANNQAGTEVVSVCVNQSGQIGVLTTPSTSYSVNVSGALNATSIYENGTALSTSYQAKVSALGSSTNPVYVSAAGTFSTCGFFVNTGTANTLAYYSAAGTISSLSNITSALTGYILTLNSGSSAESGIKFARGAYTGWGIYVSSGNLTFVDSASGTNTIRLVLKETSQGGTATFSSGIVASSISKSGGASTEFLKADGSVDSTAYLPLAGGTMTGGLMISKAGGDHITINRTGDATGTAWIRFLNAGELVGFIGVSSAKKPTFYDGVTGEKTIYHSGNSNSTSVAWSASSLTLNGSISGVSSINGRVSFPTSSSNNPVLNIQGVSSTGTDWLSIWVTATHRPLVLQYNAGNVGIGVTQPSNKLEVEGNIASTGDQVISSDINLKTNLKDIALTSEQIANAPAVSFDWKDGHGHSFGSIAQYWKPLVPEAVLGEEGSYTLAYGQLGVVLGINNGKAMFKLEQHETEQDKEIKKLREKVQKLEMDNLRLKARLGLEN